MSRRLVKVQYREKGTGRSAAITLPLDIYDSWGRPEYVIVEELPGGALLVKPAKKPVVSTVEFHPEHVGDRLKDLAGSVERSVRLSSADLGEYLEEVSRRRGLPRRILYVLADPIRIYVKYPDGYVEEIELEELPSSLGGEADNLYDMVYRVLLEAVGASEIKSLKEFQNEPKIISIKNIGVMIMIEPFYENKLSNPSKE